MTDYILNGVLGLAVGDALGQPAQGKTRESLKLSSTRSSFIGFFNTIEVEGFSLQEERTNTNAHKKYIILILFLLF